MIEFVKPVISVMKNVYFLSLIVSILCIETLKAQNSELSARSTPDNLPEFSKNYITKQLGANVFIFDQQMDMNEIQVLIDSIYNQQHPRSSEFGNNRYALLFKPGSYSLDLKIGYYTSIIGLGKSPSDVVINGLLISKGEKNGNVTCNFWRSVENVTIVPLGGRINIWGVSQASPMRRVQIKGDIQLHDNGWASGGFLADSKIDGTVYAGGQQQWYSRNVELGTWDRGSWNMMFMGTLNPPEADWPNNPYTVIKETPIIREKPYLVIDVDKFIVRKPGLKKNSIGVGWMNNNPDETEISLGDFYIAKPTEDAQSINKALSEGKNILFTPGIYVLNESLKIMRAETVLMGIGMATLRSGNGNAIIEVADQDGVTLCGLIIDAGKIRSEKLVVIGEPDSKLDHNQNPTFLHDIFIRVGGYGEGNTSVCMEINSKDVVVDHTWLWRADHGKNVGWNDNVTRNGLVVNGDRVTIYGLFCEHFHEYQTLWNGNEGKVYFYQSEMPYDPPTSESFRHGITNGYASYKVSDKVTSHEAWGLGIYCVFFKAPVIVDQAIETPVELEKDIRHKIIFWLGGGHKESTIKSIINGKGGSVDVNNVKAVMD